MFIRTRFQNARAAAVHRIRRFALPVTATLLTGYFLYHALEGDHGLQAYMRLNEQVAQERAELAALTAERQALEHRISLLHPSSLDRDMLDEEARRQLGFMAPGEIVLQDGGE